MVILLGDRREAGTKRELAETSRYWECSLLMWVAATLSVFGLGEKH